MPRKNRKSKKPVLPPSRQREEIDTRKQTSDETVARHQVKSKKKRGKG